MERKGTRWTRGVADALNSLKRRIHDLVSEAGFASARRPWLRNIATQGSQVCYCWSIRRRNWQSSTCDIWSRRFADGEAAGTTIERKASLLSLVLKPSSAAYGDSLRSAVIYETEVTWNEPHQTVTDPPLVTTW